MSVLSCNLLFVANEIDNSLPRLARPGLAHTKPIGSNWKVWSMQQPAASWHAVIWTATQDYRQSTGQQAQNSMNQQLDWNQIEGFFILICTLYLLCQLCWHSLQFVWWPRVRPRHAPAPGSLALLRAIAFTMRLLAVPGAVEVWH